MWVARAFALFVIASSRSAKVLEQLLGPAFAGILCSDRFSAYIKYHKGIAQFCWAHLKRDIFGIGQLGKTTDADHFARDALALHARLFRLWHRYRGGTIDRSQLITKAMPIEKKFFALGERYLDSKDAAVCALATLFWGHTERLFAFIYHSGVEPTNNIAERSQRRGVCKRDRTFGTQTSAGSRYVERILTTVATCRQQGTNTLTYLTEALVAYINGASPPPLIST